MPESQNTEYKQGWRDEYLKWISGFANAEGGVLVIGRNDLLKEVSGALAAPVALIHLFAVFPLKT